MMNTENKSRIFLLIIAILVITNVGLLIFFLQNKETPKQNYRQDRRAYIANFLKKEIGFDQQQLQQFDTLSTRHREKMNGISDKLKGSKEEQFRQLVEGNFTDSAIAIIAAQTSTAQKTIEIMMFNHLRNIRVLCKPAQLAKFDSLFGKVLNRKGEARRKSMNK